jgi:ABC-type lipoprotein release transport system permease subunit
MIINFQNILAAFIACLILNIISAAIPAWQASRLNPVEAINSNHK